MLNITRLRGIAAALLVSSQLLAWDATIRPALKLELPTQIDGNSAAFWRDGKLHLFSSIGDPLMVSEANSQLGPWTSTRVDLSRQNHVPVWAEASWMDEDGNLFIWYHHEPGPLCGSDSNLTSPKIGAAISYDEGKTINDLGIVLESGDPLDCNAKNGFFAGGHGDFSVVLDKEKKFFYFLFTNYGGPPEQQGVAIARLAFDQRWTPVGNVNKYYDGKWDEPGLGGRMTPAFPAAKSWQQPDTDSFWGPSVHWNRWINAYVVLLNHSCCRPNWPQEGIYLSFAFDIANPGGWLAPEKILERSAYYPQILGTRPGDTDAFAGRTVRLYVAGISEWEIVFSNAMPQAIPDPGKEKQPTELP